jgi:hypothetical protein
VLLTFWPTSAATTMLGTGTGGRSFAQSAMAWMSADVRDVPRRGGAHGLAPTAGSHTPSHTSSSPSTFRSIHGFGADAPPVRSPLDPQQAAEAAMDMPEGRQRPPASAARPIECSSLPVSNLSRALSRSQQRSGSHLPSRSLAQVRSRHNACSLFVRRLPT